MALIVDTGPLFAAYDRSDNHYVRCRNLLQKTDEELLIPAPVIAEFDWMCGRRNVSKGPLILLSDILAGAYTVVNLTVEDHARCRELLERYADADIGYVDAAVLTITERLKEPKLATLDQKHFRMLRPSHVESLHLLPD